MKCCHIPTTTIIGELIWRLFVLEQQRVNRKSSLVLAVNNSHNAKKCGTLKSPKKKPAQCKSRTFLEFLVLRGEKTLRRSESQSGFPGCCFLLNNDSFPLNNDSEIKITVSLQLHQWLWLLQGRVEQPKYNQFTSDDFFRAFVPPLMTGSGQSRTGTMRWVQSEQIQYLV